MAKVKDLVIEIEELLDQGQTPFMIAQMLDVPVSWVYEVENGGHREELSPYETCNS